jgi:hypothetical protein
MEGGVRRVECVKATMTEPTVLAFSEAWFSASVSRIKPKTFFADWQPGQDARANRLVG